GRAGPGAVVPVAVALSVAGAADGAAREHGGAVGAGGLGGFGGGAAGRLSGAVVGGGRGRLRARRRRRGRREGAGRPDRGGRVGVHGLGLGGRQRGAARGRAPDHGVTGWGVAFVKGAAGDVGETRRRPRGPDGAAVAPRPRRRRHGRPRRRVRGSRRGVAGGEGPRVAVRVVADRRRRVASGAGAGV